MNHPDTRQPDPTQAKRLQALRQALNLSLADMAQRVGLWGANGPDNLRQMERAARPIPGTLQVLLGYIEQEQASAHSNQFDEKQWATKAATLKQGTQLPTRLHPYQAHQIGVLEAGKALLKPDKVSPPAFTDALQTLANANNPPKNTPSDPT